MRGEDVRQWQARMAQRDLGRGLAADGAYGPRSEAVCRSFQRYWKLAVDGIVGPVTWKATWEKSGKP
jgi:peptidoglycan hydrolase-like protein with peptidoglycan-binding domain